MANVVELPHLADNNAYYVWAGATGPRWGKWETFSAAGAPVRARFADEDWTSAIRAAAKEADETGVPTVYVARNA